MAGGRPIKYKKENPEKLVKFFSGPPYTDKVLPHYDVKTGKVKWKDYKRFANKLPTLVGFAKSIKVSIRAVYNWTEENRETYQEEFMHAFTQAKLLQKDFLIQNGLQGLYNPIFSKFTAINITDMRDQQDVVVSFDWRTLTKNGSNSPSN